MKMEQINSELFIENRARLKKLLLPNSLAVVNANDIFPTNADGTLKQVPNSDLFYLTGIEQEQSILLLYPDADDENHREILFIREAHPELVRWEGRKLSKDEAKEISGVSNVAHLSEFRGLFHRLMCECEHVYLNSNEHKRAVIEVETREARFVADVVRRYPLHDYHRLARLMHQLRVVKSPIEVELLKKACKITEDAFRRVLRMVQPGVSEMDVEAEFAHEFIRKGARFAYLPIIGTGKNALALHYIENSATCADGEVLLLDVAANYSNYNGDMTRSIPVNGKFTKRQRQVYDAVLRVMRQSIVNLRPGKKWREWQKEGEQLMEKELVDLGLITTRDIKRQPKDSPAFKKFFMHGLGHPLGLDVHDVGLTTEPMAAGWVMTVEPAIYIEAEGLGIRLEDNVVITEKENIDLMAGIPLEAEEIEELMSKKRSRK